MTVWCKFIEDRMDPLDRPILRNGSVFGRAATQVLKSDQHGKGAFELTVEMHLVARQPHQLVGVEGLAESLVANKRPVREFRPADVVPGQDLSFKEAPQPGVQGCVCVAPVRRTR